VEVVDLEEEEIVDTWKGFTCHISME